MMTPMSINVTPVWMIELCLRHVVWAQTAKTDVSSNFFSCFLPGANYACLQRYRCMLHKAQKIKIIYSVNVLKMLVWHQVVNQEMVKCGLLWINVRKVGLFYHLLCHFFHTFKFYQPTTGTIECDLVSFIKW